MTNDKESKLNTIILDEDQTNLQTNGGTPILSSFFFFFFPAPDIELPTIPPVKQKIKKVWPKVLHQNGLLSQARKKKFKGGRRRTTPC